MTERDFSWVITEPVKGRVQSNIRVEGSGDKAVDISYTDDGKMLFDGEYWDCGDDFMIYVATLEQIADYGESEPCEDDF
jgi:hypothetical protein